MSEAPNGRVLLLAHPDQLGLTRPDHEDVDVGVAEQGKNNVK